MIFFGPVASFLFLLSAWGILPFAGSKNTMGLGLVTRGPPSEVGIVVFLGVPPIGGVFFRVVIINRLLIFFHP